MQIILLSGGSGTRLWPLSNDVRSKQFLKLFKDSQGNAESMVQRVYRQIKTAIPDANITIATSKTQVSALRNQLGNLVNLSVEPCRRDTFPAIALASQYLKDILDVKEDEPVIVCPVDPYVDNEYFVEFIDLAKRVKAGEQNIVLMGIEPTYPSEKYGYIVPKNSEKVSSVLSFKEKPNKETALALIQEGALWNGGIFAFRLKYLSDLIVNRLHVDNYFDLLKKYESLEKISFDYEVVEKEPSIEVVRFAGEWKDLGTWNTLTEAMESCFLGKSQTDDDCQNVSIINDTDMNVLALGLKDIIVAVGPQGILISDREHSSYIKPFVEKIDQQVMFAEKSWGSYRVIDMGEESLTIRIHLRVGSSMNYHSHKHRHEVWVITEGKGISVVDGMTEEVQAGDVISLMAGCKHKLIAKTDLHVVEVQLGKDISVDDKEKFDE